MALHHHKKPGSPGSPSAGISKEKRSAIVKAARKGKDLGKKGKMFSKIAEKAARRLGSKERGRRVAAAVMWKIMKKRGK